MNNFLPESDQDYLAEKQLVYELRSETLPDGTDRRAVIFPTFDFGEQLRAVENGQPVSRRTCELLVLIPPGYSTTKLDSFYTCPILRRLDGAFPDRATGDSALFGKKWQFWSRHLDEKDWRPGVDGLNTYLDLVRDALRRA